MSKIVIGSPSDKKGITVIPSKIMFNENNVKKMMQGNDVIWIAEPIALVPIMTSNTTPSGVAFASSGIPYKAFNNSFVNGRNWYASGVTNQYIGYDFEKKVKVQQVSFSQYQYETIYFGVKYFKIQYSDDNNTWIDATDKLQAEYNNTKQTYNINSGEHRYWRMYVYESSHTANIDCSLATLQFYGIS